VRGDSPRYALGTALLAKRTVPTEHCGAVVDGAVVDGAVVDGAVVDGAVVDGGYSAAIALVNVRNKRPASPTGWTAGSSRRRFAVEEETMRRRRVLAIATIMAVSMLGVAPAAAAEDGSNPAIVREGNQWHLRDSLSGGPATTSFFYGRSGDTQQMLCDWNGDGTQTPGVVRMTNDRPQWLLRNSNSGGPADYSFIYGRSGDRAVCGDWNGDGQQTPGIVRELDDGTYEWHLSYRLSGGSAGEIGVVFEFGQDQYPGDLPPAWPVVGDWNGNGYDSVGIVQGHPDGEMQWQLRDATVAGEPDFDFVYYDRGVWGDHLETHIPIVGDWNGDGQDGPGVIRGSGAVSPQWLLRDEPSAGSADHVFRYGRHLDITLSWR